MPTNTGFVTMRGKQNLAEVLLVSKNNIWGNHAFFRIRRLQFGEKRHTLFCIVLFCRIIVA